MGINIDGARDLVSAADGSMTIEGFSIHSTGIGTFTGGIQVGTAATISSNGNATLSGILTATAYHGDGSGLTGVAGTEITNSDFAVGVSTFFVDYSTARVGINTNVPAQELDVRGDQPSIYIKHTGATNTQNALYLEVKNDACEFNSYQEVTATRRPFIFKQYTDTRAVIDASGRLLINHTASVDQNAQIQSWASGTDTFAGFKYGNNAAPNIIRLGKTRNGSAGGATIVQEDDEVGRLLFQGNNGTDFLDCAAVQCYVDGEPGSSGDSTDMPGRLILATAADGDSVLLERVRIDCTGAVGINQTNPNKAKFHVVGPGSGADEIIAKFKGGNGNDCKAKIGLVAGYSDTANDTEGHAFIGALRSGSGNQAHLSFETYNGSAVAERVRITSAGHLQPGADATYNLGSPSSRWANIYSADLQLSNEGSENEIDGSWGSYTIQEGETDLFLINRRNGKKYTFNLTEVS